MKIKILQRQRGFHLFAMSDIAFLLLIFLVITVSLEEDGSITLPFFEYTQETGFSKTIPVIIDQEGSVRVEGILIPFDRLESYLVNIAQKSNVVIRLFADKNAKYENVDRVLSILQDTSFFEVVLIAEPHDDK